MLYISQEPIQCNSEPILPDYSTLESSKKESYLNSTRLITCDTGYKVAFENLLICPKFYYLQTS